MPTYHSEVRSPTQTLLAESADLPDSLTARVKAAKPSANYLSMPAKSGPTRTGRWTLPTSAD